MLYIVVTARSVHATTTEKDYSSAMNLYDVCYSHRRKCMQQLQKKGIPPGTFNCSHRKKRMRQLQRRTIALLRIYMMCVIATARIACNNYREGL